MIETQAVIEKFASLLDEYYETETAFRKNPSPDTLCAWQRITARYQCLRDELSHAARLQAAIGAGE